MPCRSISLWVLAALAAPAHAAEDWARIAREDIRFIHATLRDNHPGAIDPQNAAFAEWLERGRAGADKLASRARDYAGYFFAIQLYTNGFQDGHVYALRRDSRLPHRWPGFIMAMQGERFRVLGTNDALVECDGRSAEILARDLLAPYVGLWSVRGFRPRIAPFLLIDEGNPFVRPPRTCVFQTGGGTRGQVLEWREIRWDELDQKIAEARGGKGSRTGLRRFGNGGYWISLPTFDMSSQDVVDGIRSVSATLQMQQKEAREAAIIVFDVRGNSGGSSSLGEDVLRPLIGADQLAALTPRPVAIDWRASKANLAHVRESTIPELMKTYGEDSPEVREYRKIAAGLAAALDRGDPFYQQKPDLQDVARPGEPPPVRAKVFLLTDSACFSACLDFADVLRNWPGVIHVGAETRADTVYMEVRSEPLPSGRGSMGVAMKVYRGRARGHNQTYVPHHVWNGRMDDTAGLETWISSLAAASSAAERPPDSAVEIDALARRVAGEGDAVERAQRLVSWMNARLEWVATDYVQRTPEEILIRRAGNCAELASVLERLLRPTGIRYRWVAEINLHPESAQRQSDAAEKIRELGPRASVFGRRHNDHRWLEVFDDGAQEWLPADPATGLVGTKPWALSRMSLGPRPAPAVPAIAQSLDAMVVPFAIVTHRDATGARVDRSAHYLIDELDRLYAGKARALPSWPKWESAVRGLAPLARQAFDGKVNLHEHAALIDELASVYESLRREAKSAGLEPT